MISFNPNLILKTITVELTFFQIKASNLGHQGIIQAVKALSLIALRGHELKEAQANIYIFSPMV